MGFFDKIKEIVTESDDDEYDDFYEENRTGKTTPARQRHHKKYV